MATLGAIPYYWARLARVKIVAEVPNQEVDKFWAGGPSVQLRVLRAFARTEPKVIVGSPEAMPGHQPEGIPQFVLDMGWQKIGGTDYYVQWPKEP